MTREIQRSPDTMKAAASLVYLQRIGMVEMTLHLVLPCVLNNNITSSTEQFITICVKLIAAKLCNSN